MRVRFWGTRGSIATPGPGTNRFGGNTSCVEITTEAGDRLILDCGTGARPLGQDLMANAPKPIVASILLTHTHWDHIQGFPFFAPLFVPGNQIAVFAPHGSGRSLAETLAGQMEFNYFPVELSQLPAQISYQELMEGKFQFGEAQVIAQYLNHPAMTLAYRIEADGMAVVYACDHEMFAPSLWISDAQAGLIDSIVHEGDRRHARFLSDADLVIHDSQYTPEEYPAKRNWGHSTFEYAVNVSVAAGVKKLALMHHDPTHDDAFIHEMERNARALAEKLHSSLRVFAAFEGHEMRLGFDSGVHPIAAARPTVPTTSLPEGQRVLVVDDDPDIHVLAKMALHNAGYIALEARDAQEGLRMARDQRPDLILLDLLFEDIDGMDILRALHSSPRTASIPVIVLTKQSDEGHTRAGFDAGASDYLIKPFSVPQLVARVRSCLARARTPSN